jgi:hypothetical protein
MEYPNEVTWVMTEGIKYLDSGNVYGDCARVYVNSEWRFAVAPLDHWDRMCHVSIFTRYTDTGIQVASAHFIPLALHANITELAQALTPLSRETAFVPPF